MDPKTLGTLDLVVYGAPWCGDCRRLERWMKEAGLELPKVDIEADEAAAARLERETGKRAIPFLLVNGARWVRGYHRERPGRFDEELFLQEVLAAAQG